MFLIKNKTLLLIRSCWVASLLPTTCLSAINSHLSPLIFGRPVSGVLREGLFIPFQRVSLPFVQIQDNTNLENANFLSQPYGNMILPGIHK